MSLSRRDFVKLSSLTPMAYFLPLPVSNILNEVNIRESVADLYKQFRSPSDAARPFVRWWWNGLKIEEEELLRELDLLKEKGISGVEINSISFPNLDDPMGYQSCDWLGEKWLEMVKATVDGARKKNMTCDIIVGSGWPFGGEFLTKDEQIQLLALGTRKFSGPKTVVVKKKELLDTMNALATDGMGYSELFGLRLAPSRMNSLEQGIDLNSEINKEETTIHVPQGEHVLYYLVKLTGYTKVTHGAPGASGPVLNHYKKTAVQKFLDKMSDAMNAGLGMLGNNFRAMFIDSMELHGSNWCDDMLEEFKKRNGYDLETYLPFILFEINPKLSYRGEHLTGAYGSMFSDSLQDEINRARYDFENTRLALFQERFLETFIAWCNKNKVKSRVQTYGKEYYPLESAMLVDIPECETWLRPDVGEDLKEDNYHYGRGYRPVNKFISSAARLTGRKQVSCEEETNTSMVFNATLERIKITGDQSNLSGVNHSILHGFNYSPKEIPFPGWVRYGTFFNERNPWWPYLRRWIDYKARLSEIFQQADPQADIAVMFPWADMWSVHGVQYQQWPQFVRPKYAFNVWEAIHQNGDGCDYIDEKVLQNSTFSGSRLHYGPRSYKVLMLLDVETIAPETAVALEKFVKSGGLLLFIGTDPHKSPGLTTYKKRDALVQQTIASLKQDFPENAVSYAAPDQDIIKWYAGIQSKFKIASPVRFNKPVSHVSQVHYKTKDADIFFISNYHLEKEHDFTATFDIKEKRPWVWDPETGKKYRYPFGSTPGRLKIHLDPTESLLLVFTDEREGEAFSTRKPQNKNPRLITGSWKVNLYKVERPGPPAVLTLNKLVDFQKDERLRSFAGTVFYEKQIEIAHPGDFNYLDLGKVGGISELWINDINLGLKWYGRHIYDVGNVIKKGKNTLKVKMVTTLGNYAKSLTDNKEVQKWVEHQPYYPCGLIGPVKLY